MIAKLKGLVDTIGDGFVILDVGGVGYLVFASSKTLGQLPGPGEAAELLIETHIREDHIHLYGFANAIELEMFRLLMGVQGVGTKVALAILTILDPEALLSALVSGDKAAVAQASGVGPKLAARLINELKDKVGGFALGDTPAAIGAVHGDVFQDALAALVKLGYKPSRAHTALLAASNKVGDEDDIANLIKAALRELSR